MDDCAEQKGPSGTTLGKRGKGKKKEAMRLYILVQTGTTTPVLARLFTRVVELISPVYYGLLYHFSLFFFFLLHLSFILTTYRSRRKIAPMDSRSIQPRPSHFLSQPFAQGPHRANILSSVLTNTSLHFLFASRHFLNTTSYNSPHRVRMSYIHIVLRHESQKVQIFIATSLRYM